MEEDPDLDAAIKGGMGCLFTILVIASYLYYAYIIRI
jgi:hypothetical protein